MIRLVLAVLAFATLAAPALAADKKAKKVDTIVLHPDFAKFGLQSVAMLWPVSYDRNLPNEKLADGVWAAALRGSGYRWMSASSSRELLAARPGGDSLFQLAR